jgi:Taurine catabolism dioxygenase TauD, TfdA family
MIVAAMETDARSVLEHTAFPFPTPAGSAQQITFAPILEERAGAWRIRYRSDLTLTDDFTKLNSDASQAIEQLETTLAGIEPLRFLLKRGDVLVIDNRRILHGREAFPSMSTRRLKRLRIYQSKQDEFYTGSPSLW